MDYYLPNVLIAMLTSGLVVGVVFAIYLINAFAFYRMAQKANVRNAWLAFVPFLQFIIFFHMLDKSAWNALLLLIPIVNVVLGLVWTYRLFERFDAGGGVGIIVIIASLFVGVAIPIYFMYLGFSSQISYVDSHRFE